MSDTLRTDVFLIAQHMAPTNITIIDLARQLERELNAANERIKRMELAGDEMVNKGWNEPHLANAWRQAKEAKP